MDESKLFKKEEENGSYQPIFIEHSEREIQKNGYVDITLLLNKTHRIVSCCCSVTVIDDRSEFDSLCGERGTGTLIAMMFVLIVDEDDDEDDLDRKFRSRPST
jgi:hypothetical protein